ncbi:CbiX/SirB N-terminal domain-containing protein, partial [Staphylococcus saprophyticus]|uniref:CbiX/SirB N-terminal domain-containing protein n=1 Tax=Staphylococcus saprophyticus TaxID=29385 RepID=UPI003704861B
MPLHQTSFLELTTPNFAQPFHPLLDKPPTHISLLPLFLLTPPHYYKHIPPQIQHTHQTYPNLHLSYNTPLPVQPTL